MTWFRARPYVAWIDADDEAGGMRPIDAIVADALQLWQQNGEVSV